MKKILLTALLIQGTYSFGQNLELYYKLNDLTSTTMPANNLTLHGTGNYPVIVGGSSSGLITDSCIQFNYGRGYVSDFALNNQTWPATAISAWYRSEYKRQGTIVQGAYLGFGLRITSEGNVQAFFNGTQLGALESNVSVTDSLWHHLFVQNDGLNTYIYIDGVLDTTKAETLYKIPSPHALAKIYIGNAANDAYDQRIAGHIDELRIYSDTLSAAQINHLMNGVLSVNQQSIQRIQLYPNPTSNIINIQTDAIVISSSIFDLSGSLVATFKGHEYSVSLLRAGIYFINVQTETGIAQHKFVKQ